MKKEFMTDGRLAWIIIVAILLIDQIIKIEVKTTMCLGESIRLAIRKKSRTLYVVLLSMIVAGAAGNVIDCMFYGLIFNSSSPYYISYFVPFGTGYADFLMGKVVDMFYFPLIVTTWPEWVPMVGGNDFIFFSPVFNFADACISVGVVMMLLFCRKDMEGIGETLREGVRNLVNKKKQ